MRALRFLSPVVVSVVWVSSAHAQPAEATATPGFTTLDRQDSTSKVGVELSYMDTKFDDTTVLRFEGHGQYVNPRTGFGGYAAIPISYVSSDGALGNDSATAIGDIELGGLYAKQVGSNVGLVLHAGITLPTQSDDLDKLVASSVGLQTRVTDIYLGIPGGLSLRLGGSLLYRQNRIFARADFGVDLNLDESGSDTAKPVIRLNGGVGYDFGSAALMIELANTIVTGDNNPTIDYAAISARFRAGTVSPYAALLIPLDDDARAYADLGFTIGIDAALR